MQPIFGPHLLTLLALSVASVLAHATDKVTDKGDFYLKDGDRVVFYGDSLTAQRLYTAFTETFTLTRFPDRDVRFVHSGWGGDRVSGGSGGNIDTRLERDVFLWEPTVVTVMLGMNDGSYRAFDQNIFNTYRNGMAAIVRQLEEQLPEARITLIRPSPYDDVTREPRFKGGYNKVLLRFGESVKELANANHHQVADLNADLVETLKRAKVKNADLSTKIISDRIHPGPAGHLILASSLLDAWNAPAIVSEVAIDATPAKGNPRVVIAENTTVSDLKESDGTLSWTQLDKALPMPINFADNTVALAVESSDFVDRLNRQPLRVAGLRAAHYILKIDGQQIGIYTPEQLFDGVNLAIAPTPMLRQAEKVHSLTLSRTDTHQTRWRTIQVPFANARSEDLQQAMPQILAAFDAEVEYIRKLQRKAAHPVPHHYQLIPQRAALSAAPTLPDDFGRGPNLALNKKWVSSSPNTYGWDSGLTDGSWEAKRTKTYASGNDNKFPKTVTVDLEKPE